MTDLFASPYFTSFCTIATFYAAALISPGADIAITMRNSLVYSRRSGLFSALGTTTGMGMHLSYTLLGIGYIVQTYPLALSIIKYGGAAWLIYIGYKSMRSQTNLTKDFNVEKESKDLSPLQAFKLGFLTNALNPLVFILFICILSNEIKAGTPPHILMIFASEILLLAFSWFSFVAICFSFPKVQKIFSKLGHWLDRITGGVLIFFGLRLALKAV
jgi:RhtB (resistance to homoserine/threonine) family protein